MKVVNKNGIGNPNHDEEGKFTTADNVGNGANTEQVNNNASQAPAWLLGKKAASPTPAPNPNVPSWLGSKATTSTPTVSAWQSIMEDRWFKEDGVLSVQDVIDNAGRMCANKDVVDIVAKYGWHTTSYMGAGKTSHSSINMTLLNAIAKKRFSPMNLIDDATFNSLKDQIRRTSGLYNSYMEQEPMGYLERGLGDSRTVNNIYFGQNLPDCILPNGCYGSGLYTAYDGRTAQSYSHGILMQMIVDHSKAKVIDDNSLRRIRNQLIAQLPTIKQNIEDSMKKAGYSDTQATTMSHIFETSLNKDLNFTGVICNYDVIYYRGCRYGLGLKFKNIYTKKTWR